MEHAEQQGCHRQRLQPVPWLAIELCIPVAAVLLALRSKWVFVPVVLHCILVARQLYLAKLFEYGLFKSPPAEILLIWGGELGVLAFCLWLSLRRRLR